MAKLFNRAWMTVSGTPGTGTITLLAAYSDAYLSFAESGVADTNVVAYVIEEGNDFEIGIGAYTSAGTTLSRTTVTVSKIAGVQGTTKLTLTSAATVFLLPRASDLLSITETQTANFAFAGPTSGGAAAPAFRALVAADIPAASDTAAGGIEIAVQSEQETGTDVVRAVTPGRQRFHQSAAKAFVRFNSVGTIWSNYNITSVTDSGAGNWTVTIATDFSTENISSAAGIIGTISGTTAIALNFDAVSVDGGVFHVGAFLCSDGSTRTDADTPDQVHVIFFGDQA